MKGDSACCTRRSSPTTPPDTAAGRAAKLAEAGRRAGCSGLTRDAAGAIEGFPASTASASAQSDEQLAAQAARRQS